LRAPALLRTCRQINCEASQILWKKNSFYFDDVVDFIETIESLPSTIAESIRDITVIQHEGDGYKQSFKDFEGLKHRLCAVTKRLTSLRRLELSPSLVTLYEMNQSNIYNYLTSAQVIAVEIYRFGVEGTKGTMPALVTAEDVRHFGGFYSGASDWIHVNLSRNVSLPTPPRVTREDHAGGC
jgi:hypothetical protein